MKRKLLFPIALIFTTLLILLCANYLLSLHKTTFALDDTVSEIKVYSKNNEEEGRLSDGGNLLLQSGEYYIIPDGNNIASDKIIFTVKSDDTTITVRPSLTKAYLDELLQKDRSAIEAAIATKYPSLYPNYSLTSHTLYQKGEWFGGLLVPKTSNPRDWRDPYRVVLHKKNNTWEVIRRPEYILTSSRYSEVPVSVLRDINQLSQ